MSQSSDSILSKVFSECEKIFCIFRFTCARLTSWRWATLWRPAGRGSRCCSPLLHTQRSDPPSYCSSDRPPPQSTLEVQCEDTWTSSWSSPARRSPRKTVQWRSWCRLFSGQELKWCVQMNWQPVSMHIDTDIRDWLKQFLFSKTFANK